MKRLKRLIKLIRENMKTRDNSLINKLARELEINSISLLKHNQNKHFKVISHNLY